MLWGRAHGTRTNLVAKVGSTEDSQTGQDLTVTLWFKQFLAPGTQPWGHLEGRRGQEISLFHTKAQHTGSLLLKNDVVSEATAQVCHQLALGTRLRPQGTQKCYQHRCVEDRSRPEAAARPHPTPHPSGSSPHLFPHLRKG